MHKLYLILPLLLQSSFVFAAVEDGRWHAGIGDPTIFGWLTVLVYLVAVACCISHANNIKKIGADTRFWFVLAGVLFLLAINKQLDLQSWFTEVMRDSAKAHGWYEHRRLAQMAFIAFLGIGMLIALASLRIFLAHSWRHNKLTWLGVILLCFFIVMRAASFHHLDILIGYEILGLRINVLLENGALFLIILGTFINKKFVPIPTENGDVLKEYVEIAHDGDDVRCPKCGMQPLANPVDGRLFKCRSCGHKYRVIVQDT